MLRYVLGGLMIVAMASVASAGHKPGHSPGGGGGAATLGDLNCAANQIAKFNGISRAWECALDEVGGGGPDTLGDLNCTTDQIARFNGVSGAWECSASLTVLETDVADLRAASGSLSPVLVVVDGTGIPFATVLDVGLPKKEGLVTAVAEIEGFIGLLQVSATPVPSANWVEGIITSDSIDLFWTSDDCSGTPYLRLGADAVVPNLFDVFKVSFELDAGNSDARPLYVNSGPPAMRLLLSQLDYAGSLGDGFTCRVETRMSNAIPLMLIDPDISMTYPPPYSVQLQ